MSLLIILNMELIYLYLNTKKLFTMMKKLFLIMIGLT